MSSKSKKKKTQSKATPKRTEKNGAESPQVNRKRNIMIVSVAVLLALAAFAIVYFIASSQGESVEPSTGVSPQTQTDAVFGRPLSDSELELVEYGSGKLPRVFADVLLASQADSEAANEKYGTAMTIDGVKISVPEFTMHYCDMYVQLMSQTITEMAESGMSKSGFDSSRTPSAQTRQDGEPWSEKITTETANTVQEAYSMFNKALSEGFTLDAAQINELFSYYAAVSAQAQAQGTDIEKQFADNYCEGATFNMLAASEIRRGYASLYSQAIETQAIDSYTDEELYSDFNADPDKYRLVNVRIAPLEAREYDENAVRAVKSEQEYLDVVQAINGSVYDGYNADSATMCFGTTYNTISSKYGDTVADWIFDDSRNAGDYSSIKGAVYTCAVFILEPKYLSFSVDYRRLVVPFNADMTEAQSEEERANALSAAQDYYAQWEAGDKSEESFALLCSQFSQDLETSVDGGLVQGMRIGQRATYEEELWCFEKSRANGDCEMVEASNGIAILYFIKANTTDYDWKDACRYEKAQAVLSEFKEQVLATSDVTVHSKGKAIVQESGDKYAAKLIQLMKKAAANK